MAGRAEIAGSRRGVLLLEVIVALTIMVFALGMIGAQLVGGLRMVDEVDEQTVAIQLTDRILGLLELDPTTILQFSAEQSAATEQVVDGEYGDEYPGWHWRVTLMPVIDTEGLGQITLEILHQPDPERLESIEGARVVRAIRLLKAAPEPIDLVEDFGLSEEQAAMFGETGAPLGLDPTQLDPQAIAQMITPETLMELMPILMPLIAQMSGGQMPEGMAPEDLIGMLTGGENPLQPGAERAEAQEGAAGETDAVREMIRSALGEQVSEDELDQMMEDFGGGTGTSGNGGRGIGELDAERDQRNGRTGFHRAGKATPGVKGGRGG